jgi:hypothetical protein
MVAVCPRRSGNARRILVSVIAALLSKAQANEKTTAARMGAKEKGAAQARKDRAADMTKGRNPALDWHQAVKTWRVWRRVP